MVVAGWETASSMPLRSVIAPRSAGTVTCASCWVAATLRRASARTTPSQPARIAASASRPRKTAKRRPIRRSISRTPLALRLGGGRDCGPAGGGRDRGCRRGDRRGGRRRGTGRGRRRRGGRRRDGRRGRGGGGGGGRRRDRRRGGGGGGRGGRRGRHQGAGHHPVVGHELARCVARRAHPPGGARGVGPAAHVDVVDVAGCG